MRLFVFLLLATLRPLQAQDASALSEQAQQRLAEHRSVEAESLWTQAIRLSPDYFPALFNLGYFYLKENRVSEAEPLLRRAAGLAGDNFNAYYLLGVACRSLGRSEDALRAWQSALRIQPGNVRLMQVASVEFSKGRYFGQAARLAKAALDQKDDDPNLYFLAIKAYQDAGDYSAASNIAQRAVTKFPLSARANFEYAFHLQKDG